MDIKTELKKVHDLRLTAENAQYFLEIVPPLNYEVEKKLEEAVHERDMKRYFVNLMRHGGYLTAKTEAKRTGGEAKALSEEKIVGEMIDLLGYESVVRKWEAEHKYLREILWSAKSIYAKVGRK